MTGDEFRLLQAPIKARYRDEPAAAQATLHALGRLDGPDLTCRVETAGGIAEAGLHPLVGGDGQALCSGDMMLQSLVACAGVTLRAVATAMGITVRGGTVGAEGNLDFRGTLGVSKETPVGFTSIRLRFEVDSDASPEQLATLLRLTERYCVVFQTLRQPPAVEATITPV